jgi:cell wall-associated NlpC family hydrolase
MDISKFIGIPYKPKGSSWDGVDCLGLVGLFHKEVNGLLLPDWSSLYSNPRDFAKSNQLICQEKSAFIAIHSPRQGDIITLRIGQWTCHLGIWIDESTMLHSLDGHDSAIERLDSPSWKHRINGFYRPSDL